MLKLSPNRGEHGFSLIELMIGVVLIGILASLALPSYRVWIQNTRIRTAAESIQNGLQVARTEAVKRNSSVQFDLRGTHSAWTVCERPAVPGECQSIDNATTIQSRSASEGSSADINISGDAGPFVFNSFGAMVSPVPIAGSLVEIDVDVSTSVLSATESRELRVVVGVGGNVRMCDPATSLLASDPRKCPV
ncbi:MAG: GspH/FimT family pseudopilin [Methylotenera sp.]